jgi:hypothetical protein
MSKRNKNKKFPCYHGCHSSIELEELEQFHVCTSGLIFACSNLIPTVCWARNEKCTECGKKRCKCIKCQDYLDSDFDSVCSNNVVCSNNNEPPSLLPDDDDSNEEPATKNESPNAVFTDVVATNNENIEEPAATLDVCSNNESPYAVFSDVVATNNENIEEPAATLDVSSTVVAVTNNESPYAVFADIVATNNENIEEPAATLDVCSNNEEHLDPSNAVEIPSYELKKRQRRKIERQMKLY